MRERMASVSPIAPLICADGFLRKSVTEMVRLARMGVLRNLVEIGDLATGTGVLHKHAKIVIVVESGAGIYNLQLEAQAGRASGQHRKRLWVTVLVDKKAVRL